MKQQKGVEKSVEQKNKRVPSDLINKRPPTVLDMICCATRPSERDEIALSTVKLQPPILGQQESKPRLEHIKNSVIGPSRKMLFRSSPKDIYKSILSNGSSLLPCDSFLIPTQQPKDETKKS